MSNLIECIDCGNQVSKRAEMCPKCGAPITSLESEFKESSLGRISQEQKNKEIVFHYLKIIIPALIVFLLAFAALTDGGKKIWSSDYRECRKFFEEPLCTPFPWEQGGSGSILNLISPRYLR